MDVDFSEQAVAHLDVLYNLARYLSTNSAEAEDLVQETYARAFSAAERFVGGNLKAWLCRILRNACIDRHRRRREEQPFDDEAFDPHVNEAEQVHAVSSAELQAAVMALPKDSRMAILLELEGFSEAEMAKIFAVAPGTIKSRLSRAKARLREQLKEGSDA